MTADERSTVTIDLVARAARDQELAHLDAVHLLRARSQIETCCRVQGSTFTVVAPTWWAPGVQSVYGMPIYRSNDVLRPGLTVDPDAFR